MVIGQSASHQKVTARYFMLTYLSCFIATHVHKLHVAEPCSTSRKSCIAYLTAPTADLMLLQYVFTWLKVALCELTDLSDMFSSITASIKSSSARPNDPPPRARVL